MPKFNATEPRTDSQRMHHLPARAGSIHWGYFDASLAPALRVRSGDLIRAEAITHHAGDAPHLMMDAEIHALYAAIPEADRAPGVHIMTGPIYVEDALPGDMLEVRYLEMVPRFAFGSNLAAHWGHLYREMAERERVTIYRIDRATNLAAAEFAYDVTEKYTIPGRITDCAACNCVPALRGVRVPVRPHLGTAGVAPDVPGRVSVERDSGSEAVGRGATFGLYGACHAIGEQRRDGRGLLRQEPIPQRGLVVRQTRDPCGVLIGSRFDRRAVVDAFGAEVRHGRA